MLKYRDNTQIVLKEFDVHFKGGEKIGVVGRTGAGKSTMALALTRIIELYSGSITIDGIPIGSINLN